MQEYEPLLRLVSSTDIKTSAAHERVHHYAQGCGDEGFSSPEPYPRTLQYPGDTRGVHEKQDPAIFDRGQNPS